MNHDVIIVGGGPAGLNAALILGRCRRSVLVLDGNEPRNRASRGLHGYLTRDGVSPFELRLLGERDLARYPSVKLRRSAVTAVRREETGFEITTRDGAVERSRLLLLATGRVDPLPDRPGFREFYGHGVYHCPYCDGWEHRDQAIAVYGGGQGALDLALRLLTWSRDVTLCTDGPPRWAGGQAVIPIGTVRVVTDQVRGLEGDATGVRRVCFATGAPPLPCGAVFFSSECEQRSTLPERLGCQFDKQESVVCAGSEARGVPGLFVAGNVRGGVHLAITAAAEGAEAAIAMNDRLAEAPPATS